MQQATDEEFIHLSNEDVFHDFKVMTAKLKEM